MTHTQEHRNYGFVIGLTAGTFIGAGLTMWLAPRVASEIRGRVTDSAARLRNRASDQYQQASTRVVDAVDEFVRKGQGVRDDIAAAVVRGAQEVELYAASVKTDRR